VSEQLLTVFKLSLLGLLYLFFFRVVRAVWAELSPPPVPAPSTAPSGRAAKRERKQAGRAAARQEAVQARSGSQLTVVEPRSLTGRSFEVGIEATLGRATGCSIAIDDDFVSQLHARVFRSDGALVVEDLGSTNGTFLNGRKVGGPRPMQPGDRLKVGDTVLELR
jgi:hypothetical protein